MKPLHLLAGLIIFSAQLNQATAQNTAINNSGSSPDASAILDVSSTTKGVLVPRMTSVQRTGIVNPAKGLMVYQTNLDSGFYYNAGSPTSPNWINLLSTTYGWNTKGNSGTNPSTNFLGTTDNQPLAFKLNNTPAGKFDHVNRNY